LRTRGDPFEQVFPVPYYSKEASMQTSPADRPIHGHHKIAAAVFVGSLILGGAMILSAELMKPERYEFHPGTAPTNYIIYDRDTGRATNPEFNSQNPTAQLAK
jgi:hypothetical protein